MTSVVENKAPNQLGARQKQAGQQADVKSELADGKSQSFDDAKASDKPPTMTTHTTTNETTTTTLAAIATGTIQYDVEHLATFSTATSHEQADLGATTTTTAKTTTSDNARDKSSKFKLKQQTTGGGQSAPSANVTEPREALQRLFELEKLSGIWTQRMQIGLQHEFMLIVDCETNSIVERFHRDQVTRPEAFNHYNDIYNNIIVFNIDQQHQDEQRNGAGGEDCDKIRTPGELHIFQCVSHKAKQLVADIQSWKSSSELHKTRPSDKENSNLTTADDNNLSSEQQSQAESPGNETPISKRSSQVAGSKDLSKEATGLNSEDNNQMAPTTTDSAAAANKPAVTLATSFKSSETVPIVNVNVKETVQVFNQIAALREKSSGQQTARPLSDASSSSQSASSQQTTSSEFSRAPLGPNGQSNKQRSIRATLAPKVATDARDEPTAATAVVKSGLNNNQKRSTTSSSSSNVSSSAGPTGRQMSKLAAAQSESDHHHQHSSNRNHSLAPATLSSEATPTTTSRHDGKLLQKHTASHNGNHAQASLSGQHNHDHNHQHQHNHRQTQLVKGKSSAAATTTNGNNKSSRMPATNGHRHQNHHDVSPGAGPASSNSSGRSGRSSPPLQQQQQQQQNPLPPDEQVTSNESYVSVLNHCFDDIEKFILRIQHAYAAMRELQTKRRHSKSRSTAPALAVAHKSHHPNGPLPPLPSSLNATELARLVAQAQGPSSDDYFEILSKFKLAFNLLAKLKGCIHEPNAPELVHFLFTPLAIIIKSARNLTPPVDPTVVGIPYLNRDALELLSNCCNSKESDLWFSLGPNWTETIDGQLLRASRLPNSFQPIFSDGWAPVISELELIGLVAPPIGSPNGQHNGAHLPPPSINKPTSKTKQTSPSSRYADPTHQTGYRADHHLEEAAADLIEAGPQPIVDLSADPYRVPDASGRDHYKQKQISRHSMPGDRLPIRNGGAKQLPGHRRNSDFVGQYAPPSSSAILNKSFVESNGPDDLDLNGRYAAGYSTNPSNDYTELQIDYLQNGHNSYLAPSTSSHNRHHHHGDHNLHQLDAVSGQGARRGKGSKSSSYNRRYLVDAHEPATGHYEEDQHGGAHHQLMVHDAEREAMLLDMGPVQTEWFYELKLRGALIVRVLFTREANNDKELTVRRGEILEILDDTRKWWKARNIGLQVAYVPHTIVAVMEHYQTLDELLTGSSSSDMIMMINDDQVGGGNGDSRNFASAYHESGDLQNQYYGFKDERRNSKNANGAFRYF